MKETFANKVRKKMLVLGQGGREFRMAEVCDALDLIFDKEKHPVYQVFKDFRKAGEIERLRKGVYVYKGKQGESQIQERMWRIIRFRKIFSNEDLQELAEASEEYAKEYIQLLVKREIVKKNSNGKYVLINDPFEMPRNNEKAERLRLMRQKKDEALDSLDKAFLEISKARMAIADIREDSGD